MNENIMRQAGFGEQVDRFKEGICTFCMATIDTDSFRDGVSRREYEISGLCQNCQDATFKELMK